MYSNTLTTQLFTEKFEELSNLSATMEATLAWKETFFNLPGYINFDLKMHIVDLLFIRLFCQWIDLDI